MSEINWQEKIFEVAKKTERIEEDVKHIRENMPTMNQVKINTDKIKTNRWIIGGFFAFALAAFIIKFI